MVYGTDLPVDKVSSGWFRGQSFKILSRSVGPRLARSSSGVVTGRLASSFRVARSTTMRGGLTTSVGSQSWPSLREVARQ